VPFIYAVIFLSLGVVQKQRAEAAAYALAEQRGHEPVRVQVKPSFANRHLWKTIYEYDDHYYVDTVSASDPNLIVDIRYSFLPNMIDPMWGVEVSKQPINTGDEDAHAGYRMIKNTNSQATEHFLEMLF